MTIQDVRLFSLVPAQPGFADPDWRGGAEEGADEVRLRPLSEIQMQIERLSTWIGAGGDYGWLGAYQARRATYELQSIRAQIAQESAGNGGALADKDRRAVQARLDRLAACLEAARTAVGVG